MDLPALSALSDRAPHAQVDSRAVSIPILRVTGPDDPDESGAAPADTSGEGENASRSRGRRTSKRHKRRRGTKRPAGKHRKPRRGKRLRLALQRGSRHPWAFAAGGLFVVLATAAILLFFGFARLGGPGTTAVEIDWPPDLDPEQAASLLDSYGLVRSASGMALYLRTTGGTAGFVAGPHVLPRHASPHELRELLLRSPDRPSVRVVIPEGFHRFDIADRLHKLGVTGQKAFVASTEDRALLVELGIDAPESSKAAQAGNQERTNGPPESAEGYLFPATYELLADTEAKEVVRRLVAESDKRWSALVAKRGLAGVPSSLGWGRREILTLASIIQREAMVDDERPIIASVFYNRLLDPDFKPRRRLQSDPTAMYGCVAHPQEAPTCAEYRGKPTSAILHDPKNRYSTYMAPGLPPGPISNPGEASIEAVLAPASTKYYFFVAKGGGRHTFSETFGAHNDVIRARTE